MAKTYVTGDQQSDQNIITSTRKRGFEPRLNEVDTQTRDNRKNRKANVEVLPASTAIVNVYQLVDKVDLNGKKFKKYYPALKPGFGFIGFGKIRGKMQSVEEPIEKSQQKSTSKTFINKKEEEEPIISDKVREQRSKYSKFTGGRQLYYTSDTDVIGNIDPKRHENIYSGKDGNKLYLKDNGEYRNKAISQYNKDSRAGTFTPYSTPAFNAAAKKVKSVQSNQAKVSTKPEVSVYASKDGIEIIKELRKLNVQYFAKDQANKVNNDNYDRYDLSNPDDINQIHSAIKIMKNNRRLTSAEKIPYPMALVGEKSNSPSLSKFVYVRKEDLTYRKNKQISSKVKRPLHKKSHINENKHKVVLKKKGGKR